MHIECLTENAGYIFGRLAKVVNDNGLILAGGTALALHLGPRVSVDLDFFTNRQFKTDEVFQRLRQLKLNPVVQQEERGTLTTLVNGVKVSVYHYPYPFQDIIKNYMNIPVAGILDIASMKIIAICQRGSKRDFADLYFILQDTPIWKISRNMVQRYGGNRVNPVVVGKSLVYFNDAEEDPEPQYNVKQAPSWPAVKKFFLANIRHIDLSLESENKAKQDAQNPV